MYNCGRSKKEKKVMHVLQKKGGGVLQNLNFVKEKFLFQNQQKHFLKEIMCDYHPQDTGFM